MMADGATPPMRKIIHVDMDAFYASVEQRDDPALRGKPVAVGGSRARGVVAAASYEARAFGVRSAMPSVTAIRRCPDLVFVRPRFEVYKAVSNQIRAIFADYTDAVEPLSLDEAYLDVSEDRHGLGSAKAIAEQIRARIKQVTGPHRVSGGELQQVHCQTGIGPEQARRPLRHPAAQGRRLRRLAAGQALPWRRAGDGAADGAIGASSPAPTCATGRSPFCNSISAPMPIISTAPRAGRISARCARIAPPSRSVRSGRSKPI